ncbi:hypothetical protein ACFFIX_19605 [Metabacillus herbersteinensis]|uniref:Uncharacterized protein n=1 Tax=Metabacillus herbersteinensis TaxID=283816 RepID=A0ABV6GIT0_9BACI
MYYVEIKSDEDFMVPNRFKTTLKINITDKTIKEQTNNLIDESNAYLIAHYNPLFWLYTASPFYITINNFKSDLTTSHRLTADEEMIFFFNTKRKQKQFEKKVIGTLTRYLDKKIESLTL